MKEIRRFNNFRLDLPNGIFRIDKVDIPMDTIKEFKLEFKNGHWTMDYKTSLIGSLKQRKEK